jgi:hypothetical protein
MAGFSWLTTKRDGNQGLAELVDLFAKSRVAGPIFSSVFGPSQVRHVQDRRVEHVYVTLTISFSKDPHNWAGRRLSATSRLRS